MVPCLPKGLTCDTGEVVLVVVASVCLEVPLLGSYPIGNSIVSASWFESYDLIFLLTRSS